MKSRISMFSVLLMCCVMLIGAVGLAAEQPPCVINADGSMSCPQFAPPLPAGSAAYMILSPDARATQVSPAAVAVQAIGAGDRLSIRDRRKLGITFQSVLKRARALHQQGVLDTEDPNLAGSQIAGQIVAENPALVQQICSEDGRDWSEFFDALISFLERLMPLILQLIDLFGGLAQAVLPEPVSIASLVPVHCPPPCLAA